jgi:hypothetical protein
MPLAIRPSVSVCQKVMAARGPTSEPPMAASRHEPAPLSDGLGFRGVIKEKHTFVRTGDGAGSGYSLAATDDAGNRLRR